jgi:type II secretion system protein L
LVAVLTLEAVATNIEWWRLANEKRALTKQMERNFRNAFGEESVVVDPALQMQRNLAALHHAAGMPDESDFLSLLDGSASVFAALPSGSVRALHYEAGRLDVDVHLANANELGALQLRLLRIGYSAHSGDVHSTNDGIDTRLTLQREGTQ